MVNANTNTDLLADLKNEQKQTKTILRALGNLPVASRERVLNYVEAKLPAIPAPAAEAPATTPPAAE